MAGPVTALGDIPNLLRPGLDQILTVMADMPAPWKKIYAQRTSDMVYEIDAIMKPTGLAREKADGQTINFSNTQQQYLAYYFHKTIALGLMITRQAVINNLYEKQFPDQATQLRTSMMITKDILSAALFNNGFDATNYPGPDGKALYSTSHPVEGGTYANTFASQVDLNETSLQQAINGIMRFPMQSGQDMLANVSSKLLVVPINNQWAANVLLNSPDDPTTANRSINPLKGDMTGEVCPQGYVVHRFITDQNSWYVQTDAPIGFKYYQRMPVEIDSQVDFPTKTVMWSIIEDYSFGYTNAQASWGSSGST